MNAERVDLLIQYALAVAGQSDDWQERELGPIHLLKYVYLGDVAFAERNGGKTFTEAPWRFYKFGPWAGEVHDRIAPAVAAIGANEKKIEWSRNGREGEMTRWSLSDDLDEIIADIERKIPATMSSALRGAVRKFSGHTPELLHHVYNTEPMLHAAPNEMLSFDVVPQIVPVYRIDQAEPLRAAEPGPSDKQRKKRREAVEKVRARLKAIQAPRYVAAEPPPVDDVFLEGLKALDADGGDELREMEGEIEFSGGVWKSGGRHERGAP